ncbi:MAG: N-acetyltransferase family protein [Blautia sp.]|jgi:L-amino acid N-acyltransferase YncA
MIRMAKEEDVEKLLKIYGEYIHTPITFEYVLPKVEEFKLRVRDTLKEYPYLVWEEEGELLGYAYAHRLRERAAYLHSAELTVYVAGRAVGKGVGRALYQALFQKLKEQGVRMVYGCVTRPNERSEGLHQSLGFALTGIFHKVGYKNGQWLDVSWFEKEL